MFSRHQKRKSIRTWEPQPHSVQGPCLFLKLTSANIACLRSEVMQCDISDTPQKHIKQHTPSQYLLTRTQTLAHQEQTSQDCPFLSSDFLNPWCLDLDHFIISSPLHINQDAAHHRCLHSRWLQRLATGHASSHLMDKKIWGLEKIVGYPNFRKVPYVTLDIHH